MSIFSPTAQGFRLIFRRPAIPFAEIVWRWTVGVGGWFLLAALLTEYANTLQVNKLDRLLLGTRQPALVLRALQRIFHGSALRFTESGIVLTIAMTIAWIVIASLGRLVTLRSIAAEFEVPSAVGWPARVSSLAVLNFLRAAVTLAAVAAGIGSFLLPNGVWASTHASVAGILRAGSALFVLVCLSWAIVNWLLSTAGLFVVINGSDASRALGQTVRWFRQNLGSVIAVGIWFGLPHLGAFLVAFGAVFTVLGQVNLIGGGPTITLELLIIALYCAVADLLYVGRLAAYLWISGGKDVPVVLPRKPLPYEPTDARAAVDQGELILSDVPLAAT
jgi:hypothetical protein